MSESLFPTEAQAFLKALASETRQQILCEFASGDALTVGEVAQRCGIGQSTASEQLAILRHGGCLTSARTGKRVQYRADPAGIRAQLDILSACLAHCCPPATAAGG